MIQPQKITLYTIKGKRIKDNPYKCLSYQALLRVRPFPIALWIHISPMGPGSSIRKKGSPGILTLTYNIHSTIQDVKKWFVHRNSWKIMHFVKTRLNCNIKYGTQSRLNGGYKIPTFFCILRFLRTFDSLNFEKMQEDWWGLLNLVKTQWILN
jgi:hypothetical protein